MYFFQFFYHLSCTQVILYFVFSVEQSKELHQAYQMSVKTMMKIQMVDNLSAAENLRKSLEEEWPGGQCGSFLITSIQFPLIFWLCGFLCQFVITSHVYTGSWRVTCASGCTV